MKHAPFIALAVLLTGVAGPPARAADLVTNGGFETGDFTGWTTSDASLQIDTFFAAAGSFDAAFTGGGTLSRTLLTSPGLAYTLSFTILDQAGLGSDTFHVAFGGFSTDISGLDASTFTNEILTIPGADVPANAVLSFQATGNADGWNLDDVSVVTAAIPEPPAGLLLIGAALALLSTRWRARTGAEGA